MFITKKPNQTPFNQPPEKVYLNTPTSINSEQTFSKHVFFGNSDEFYRFGHSLSEPLLSYCKFSIADP